MQFGYFLLALIFGLTFAVYYFDVRKDCRWISWLAAIVMTGFCIAIDRLVENAILAHLIIQLSILLMLGLSIPARYWFGHANARRATYREHHIKATRYLPW
ncbi:MAG: hypothetical protein NVV72_07760 [Asticcacaulis sp.]|nr:hypothetical protein [Asticcacaulis sp.]